MKALYEYSLTLAPDDPMLELTPTKADVDAAYSVYRQSVLSLDGSKLGLESAQLAVDDAQASLDAAIALAQKRQVYAPISGLVVVMNLERGSRLSSLTSFGQVPIQIADVSQMRLTISVNELDILGVKPGMQAIINVDALMDYTAEAEVLRVASTSSNSDYYYGGGLVYYSVDLLLKDPDPRLKIGMTANAQIITLSYENVLLVNTMALQSTVDSTYLQVLDADGSVRNVPVELIASDYSVAVVSGAIKEGDEVLLGSGSYNTMPMIRSGVDVDVEPVR
ncbi:MAG: efflux RND transporter periplasmic adaptor subunit [Coriobacteriia bacterium]|nr:efflux RND transporter periplasmic adaptor subunit [Coriobacteriia bacterium]